MGPPKSARAQDCAQRLKEAHASARRQRHHPAGDRPHQRRHLGFGSAPIAVEYQHDGLPTIAEDQDGVFGGVNFQRAKTAPGSFTWYDWSMVGGQGDWVLRAGVMPDPNAIFSDDFESEGLEAWSASQTGGGDLTVSDEAMMANTGYGLKAVVNDTTPLYVEDARPSAEGRYRARFYFDPNGFDPGISQNHLRTRIFIAFSGDPTRRVAAIVLRRQGSTFSVMGRARLDDNSQADTGFVTISDAPHYIELDMKRSTGPNADDGYLQIWIDNTPSGGRAGLDNSATFASRARAREHGRRSSPALAGHRGPARPFGRPMPFRHGACTTSERGVCSRAGGGRRSGLVGTAERTGTIPRPGQPERGACPGLKQLRSGCCLTGLTSSLTDV